MELNAMTAAIPNRVNTQTGGNVDNGNMQTDNPGFLSVLLSALGSGSINGGNAVPVMPGFLQIPGTVVSAGETVASLAAGTAGMELISGYQPGDDGEEKESDTKQLIFIDPLAIQQAAGLSSMIAAEQLAAALGVQPAAGAIQNADGAAYGLQAPQITDGLPTAQIPAASRQSQLFQTRQILSDIIPDGQNTVGTAGQSAAELIPAETQKAAAGQAVSFTDIGIQIGAADSHNNGQPLQQVKIEASVQSGSTGMKNADIAVTGSKFSIAEASYDSGSTAAVSQADTAGINGNPNSLQYIQLSGISANNAAANIRGGSAPINSMGVQPRAGEKILAGTPDTVTVPLTVNKSEAQQKGEASFSANIFEAQKLYKADLKLKISPAAAAKPDEPGSDLLNAILPDSKPRAADLVTGAENEIPFDEAMGKGIIDQVKTGIAQKLDAGDSKFVVKLKPEGLGEIAVEMAQKSGKIVLDIITSSAQTEKLLTRELAGLRDSLRLYNAEVRQVTSAESGPDAFSYFTNQDTQGYSQGRLDQWQYASGQQRSFASWQNVSETGSGSGEAEAEYRSGNSLLNRYA